MVARLGDLGVEDAGVKIASSDRCNASDHADGSRGEESRSSSETPHVSMSNRMITPPNPDSRAEDSEFSTTAAVYRKVPDRRTTS